MQFKEIIGQYEVKQRLIQTVNDGRISHAQLFMGPEGSGNLCMAIAYAQYIACANRQTDDSCGSCPACIKYQKFVHPDLHFSYPIISSPKIKTSTAVLTDWREAITENPYLNLFDWLQFLGGENKQGIIPVDESAEIMRKLSLTTFEGGYKVMIIWMPEKMNTQSANKLLKILEEPPDKTLFLLVTENEDQLLRTIISRTQLVKLNKIADADLIQALMNKHQLQEKDATRIAYLADGSYNEAKLLLINSQEESFNFTQFRTWMRICFKRDALAILKWVDEMAGIGRERHKNFLKYGMGIIREALMLNYNNPSLVRLQGDELDFALKFAPFINGNNVELVMDEFNKSLQHVERNANTKILFTDMSLKLFALLKLK
jgi:DNA polymerase III subunit delta'